jgi:16S rRNA G966 N2-methylase RsmD
MEGAITFLRLPVGRAVERLGAEGRRFALVFADPPYAKDAVAELVQSVGAAGLLDDGGTLCIEHGSRETAPEGAATLARVDQRRFGDTVVSLYRRARVP